MCAVKIHEILHKITTAVCMTAAALFLLTPIFIYLIGQGWQHPLQSLQVKAEMQVYLEDIYTGQDLHIGFPAYNPIMDEFTAFIKDGEGTVLSGLAYRENIGVTEREAFQAEDGRYCLTVE